MAIEKLDSGLYDVECTTCGDIETIEAANWEELMGKMKVVGWTKSRVDDEWEHYCPTCSNPAEDEDEAEFLDDDDEDYDDDDDEDDE